MKTTPASRHWAAKSAHFGQKAIARMNRFRPAAKGGVQYSFGRQITLFCWRGTDKPGLIGVADVQSVSVRFRIDRNSRNSKFLR